ncbi:MAG: glycoside hydrolase family 5 protein, partial [Deltaproteobacteria bacterium]|nr:glycoside hydrolase family 5 protein [Deltaproteobacteria bacterium]
KPNGETWMGRGVNIHDTRSCGALTSDTGEPLADNATGMAEVKRRIDAATGEWKANFLRLALESRRAQDNYLNNSAYRALVKEIVDYIGSKPGVYVMVSLWLDTSFDDKGLPTANTNAILEQLAKDFYNYDYVMFGVSNEPQENYDGAQDADVWNKMNAAVATIRKVEDSMGGNHHLVSVQGTREWARYLDYYLSHPITAGNGTNIIYETHVYNAPADFNALFLNSGKSIPVVIGEYGPINDQFHKASVQDMQTLMSQANAASIPYLAWTFHHYCLPNLIADKLGATWDKNTETDGLGMDLNPTDFGLAVKADLNGKNK